MQVEGAFGAGVPRIGVGGELHVCLGFQVKVSDANREFQVLLERVCDLDLLYVVMIRPILLLSLPGIVSH